MLCRLIRDIRDIRGQVHFNRGWRELRGWIKKEIRKGSKRRIRSIYKGKKIGTWKPGYKEDNISPDHCLIRDIRGQVHFNRGWRELRG